MTKASNDPDHDGIQDSAGWVEISYQCPHAALIEVIWQSDNVNQLIQPGSGNALIIRFLTESFYDS